MTATAERLKSFAERILKMMDERDGITGDIADVFQEVKSAGFNGPAFRKVIAAMRMDPEKRETLEFDIDAYRLAVGLDRAKADEMLAEGKGIRETSRATGVPLATLHRRSKAVAKSESGTPPSEAPPIRKDGEREGRVYDVGAADATEIASDTPSTTGSTLPPAGNDAHRSSSAAPSPVVETPKPFVPPVDADVDAGWQAKDGHDSYILALQVANGKVPHPADLARMTEAELVERALAAKPAQPWRAA